MEPAYLLMEPWTKEGKIQTELGGLVIFKLQLMHPEVRGKFVYVNSGQASNQKFRAHDDPKAKPGSYEPLPEGRYAISDPIYRSPTETWPQGIGDRTMPLTPLDFLVGGRSAFEIHPDANRPWAPGSAGCPTTENTEDWDRVAYWVKVLGAKVLYVNYGLGKVKLPKGNPAPVTTTPPEKSGDQSLIPVKRGLKELGKAKVENGVSYPTLSLIAALNGEKTDWNPDEKVIYLVPNGK